MKVSVHGLPPGLNRHEFVSAAKFYARSLMSDRLVKNLTVTITFEKTRDDGSCLAEDFERPRDFIINLNNKHKSRKALIALAHEMVHVKQYATGELRDYVKSTSLNRWQGKMIDDSKISYWDRPWEIEAFGREFGLYARFKESTYETKGHKT